MNTINDFKVGDRVRLLRYGGRNNDSMPWGPGKDYLGTVTGTAESFYVCVDFSENPDGQFSGERTRCLPNELEVVVSVAKTEEKSVPVIYNGEDLEKISKAYNAIHNVIFQQGLSSFTAVLKRDDWGYILAEFRLEDDQLVADLSRYGKSE